jgi:receptor expression-enhancing protein 5/6
MTFNGEQPCVSASSTNTNSESPCRLTYWVVYGFFVFIESFVDLILYWFPFYFTFKTLAIVWLMLPQTQGAKLVYHKALRPIFANVIGANSHAGNNPAGQAAANLRQNAHAATGSSGSVPAVPQ